MSSHPLAHRRSDATHSATRSATLDSPPRRRGRVRSALAVEVVVLLAVIVSLAGYALVTRQRAALFAWASGRPVIRADFPDPAALQVGGVFYVYASNAAGKHIQVARSTDLLHWTQLPDALPTLPAWATPAGPWVWAPAVIQIGAQFVMYYTAQDAASRRQCVGMATSDAPTGPFHDPSARPFVCQLALGGTIDPAPFRDGAALYLYFKSDGNCCHQATRLWGQRLAPNGRALIGRPTPLLTNDLPWEGDVVEAPSMLAHDGQYDLFYAGNDYATARYATGYARCQTPLGPCAKPASNQLLASAPGDLGAPAPLAGPGGASLFQANGGVWVVFHAWAVDSAGGLGASRYMLIGRLTWRDETPIVTVAASPSPIS